MATSHRRPGQRKWQVQPSAATAISTRELFLASRSVCISETSRGLTRIRNDPQITPITQNEEAKGEEQRAKRDTLRSYRLALGPSPLPFPRFAIVSPIHFADNHPRASEVRYESQ